MTPKEGMGKELKGCPWCGKPPKVYKGGGDGYTTYISCCDFTAEYWCVSQEEIIRRWNTRKGDNSND